MRYLRQYIRALIRETPEQRYAIGEMIHASDDEIPTRVDAGIYHQYYAAQNPNLPGFKKIKQGSHDEKMTKMAAYFDLRRDVKRYWNEEADHKFIQNPNNILPVHDLTYYEALGLKDFEDLNILDFVKKYPPGVIQKDEMSTFGYTRKTRDKFPYLAVILKGRITFVMHDDAFTESRSLATAADIERHRQSGLPKRPGISTRFNFDKIIFDKSDLEEIVMSERIGEVTVDNWTYDTIIFDREKILKSGPVDYNDPVKWWKKRIAEVEDIEKQLKKAGLKVIQRKQ